MSLDITKEILALEQLPDLGMHLATALRKLQDATNNLGQNVAVNPTGTLPPPPPVQELQVKTNGTGLVHAVINDQNSIQKNLHYFIEYDTNPAFPQPQVKHLGASRTMEPIQLPANDDNGNPQKFYFRAYSQYQGSKPGPKVNFGGSNATSVAPGGSQNLTLLPSTGSGTAQPNGQQGGSGFGKVLFRGPQGPKRVLKVA